MHCSVRMAAVQGLIEDEASKRAAVIIARRADEIVAEKLLNIDGFALIPHCIMFRL